MTDTPEPPPSTTMIERVEKIVNKPTDCPTILVDGFTGVAVTGGVVRLNLLEDKYDTLENMVVRRYAITLAIPLQHFEPIVKELVGIIDDMKAKSHL